MPIALGIGLGITYELTDGGSGPENKHSHLKLLGGGFLLLMSGDKLLLLNQEP